ncbi:MAG: hypothetical protein RIM99_15810 [Cyclobacteriaceae bacterium]
MFKLKTNIKWFLLFCTCACSNSSEIGKRWVVINHDSITDPIIYDFKKKDVFLIDQEGELRKREWDFYQDQLIIEGDDKSYDSYDITRRGRDTLFLTNETKHHMLVDIEKIKNKGKLTFTRDSLSDFLRKKSWTLEIEDRIFKVEFISNSHLLFFSKESNGNNESYVFSGIVDWAAVTHHQLTLVKTKGHFGSNLFFYDGNNEFFSGVAVLAASEEKFEKFQLKLDQFEIESAEKLTGVLPGFWRSKDVRPSEKIPNALFIGKDFLSQVLFCPSDPDHEINRSRIQVNNSGEIILLDIDNPYPIIVESFSNSRMILKFPRSMRSHVFVRTNEVYVDDFLNTL